MAPCTKILTLRRGYQPLLECKQATYMGVRTEKKTNKQTDKQTSMDPCHRNRLPQPGRATARQSSAALGDLAGTGLGEDVPLPLQLSLQSLTVREQAVRQNHTLPLESTVTLCLQAWRDSSFSSFCFFETPVFCACPLLFSGFSICFIYL